GMSWLPPLSISNSYTGCRCEDKPFLSVRRASRDGAPAERELVLDAELQHDRIARPRETEAGTGDELDARPSEPSVDDGEDVMLLRARPIDRADLADAPEELDPRDDVPRQPVVHARGVVELQRAALL